MRAAPLLSGIRRTAGKDVVDLTLIYPAPNEPQQAPIAAVRRALRAPV